MGSQKAPAASGLKGIPQSAAQQAALKAKNMAQAQALPPDQRARYAQQSQMAQAASTPQRAQGLGSAMSGPKTGLGTAMGMNKMAGAGAALGKAFGAKKGGKVSSKMGKVKTGSGRDGVAERGHTKGMQPKMTKRG